jgi:DNA polymerase III subunit delta'
LPTIRSRCQMVKFAPVPTADIEEYLLNERAFSRDEARVAARAARGSISRAVSINVADFRADRGRMLDVITGIIHSGGRASVLKISEEMSDAKHKENFEENLDILESLIHDVWTLCKTSDCQRLVNADLEDELKALAANVGGHDLAGWLRDIETMRLNFAVNINRRVATDALFTAMVAGQ